MEDKRIFLSIGSEDFGVAILALDHPAARWPGTEAIRSSTNFFEVKPQYYSFVLMWKLSHMRQ
jgi:hypothetical protein